MIDMHGTRDFATASSNSRTPGDAILRLLHAQTDEVVVLRIDTGRRSGGHLAGQLARVEHDRILAPPYRQAHAKAFGVDQIGLRRQADQMNRVAAKQHFGGEERAVGRAHK